MIGEYNADGIPQVEYVWMDDKPVAAIYGSGTATKIYWIASDVQNTPRRLINAADATTTVWAWDSTTFGVGLPSVQTVKFNLRFPGQYYDELTKQHYNHNRFYNPALGRYVEPDRIGLEGGLNPYIYANGNPVDNYDIEGLNPIRNDRIATMRPTTDPLIAASVLRLEQQIRIFNPTYRYNVVVPAGQPTHSMRDVFFLQSELNRVRSPSPAGSIRNVNPTGSNYNCVGCAIGTDYTLAGRPTSALPSNRATPISYLENLYGRSFSYPVNNISFITNRMQQAGNGSRGIVYGSRGQNTIGHVFNVVNQNGTIRFLDGQTGGQAQFAGYIYFQLLRTN